MHSCRQNAAFGLCSHMFHTLVVTMQSLWSCYFPGASHRRKTVAGMFITCTIPKSFQRTNAIGDTGNRSIEVFVMGVNIGTATEKLKAHRQKLHLGPHNQKINYRQMATSCGDM